MTLLSKLAGRLASSFRISGTRRDSEQDVRFQRVFDLSSVAMLWATPDSRIIRANKGMAELTGYSADELENMPYESLLPPDDRNEYQDVLAAETKTGQSPKDRERRYVRKDGTIVWGLRSVTLVLSPSGIPLYKFVMIQDITERKQAQQALLEEERALAILNRTAEELNAELDLGTLLPAVTDAGVELIGAEFGALYSSRKSPGEGYKLHSLSGIARDVFERLPMARNTAELFEPLLGGGAARRDDVLQDERFAGRSTDKDAAPVRSYLTVPLVSRSKDVIGALFFGHSQSGIFTARSERILTALASHAAIAIEKASLFDAAQQEIETRKKMQAALNESEARFRDFAEAGSDLLWETDDRFRIMSIVGDSRAVLGLPEEAMISRTVWELAGADTTDTVWKRHIEDHKAWRPFRNFEYQIADQNGVTRWISANGRPYFDQHGSFLGYRGASTNIAARKHAEVKLAASARQQQSAAMLSQLALQRVPCEELYQVVVEVVSRTLEVELTGILELSADKRVLRLRAGNGWPPQSVNIRAVPVDYCPPLARGVNSNVPVHFSRRNFNLIPDSQSASGAGVVVPIGEKPVRSGVLVVCSNGVRAFSESDTNFLRAVSFVLAADAEQRKTEATLRLRDRALEATAEGILITDATEFDNPLIYVNPAFERITGYSRDESVGRNARFLQGNETERNAVQAIRAAVEGEETFRGSVLNYRKDGSSFWNGLTISPIVDENGAKTHFVGILSDETARMQLESQLWQAQKMESLGHLTGGIAHDFNNLLAVILGNSEILCDEIDDPAMKEIAELVMTTAERGADLTQRLLAFGRRQALHPETLDLGDVIGSLSEMLRRTIGDHVTLETLAKAEQSASVDRNLFDSAVLNLVLNARDAMPNGGVLTISTDVVHAASGLAGSLQPGEYVCVSVTDTGVGMTKDVLDRAFDPFFTTKTAGKGSGMGLSMVYGFAKQSGGHVTVDSEVGHGTSVRMYLPVAPTNEQVAQDGARTPRNNLPATGGTEKILVVEDEPQLRRFVFNQLRGLGYDVLEAEAGAPALDLLRCNPEIDLLFTDVLMPGGMSGFDLVQRAREVLPHLKVLLTTGYAAETDSMIANIKEPILKKPYKKQQLAWALRSILERAA
jgi:PAS domain S-box-containing protein